MKFEYLKYNCIALLPLKTSQMLSVREVFSCLDRHLVTDSEWCYRQASYFTDTLTHETNQNWC